MRFAPAHAKTVSIYIKLVFMTLFMNSTLHNRLRNVSLTNAEGWIYKLSDLASSKHHFPVLMLAGVGFAH